MRTRSCGMSSVTNHDVICALELFGVDRDLDLVYFADIHRSHPETVYFFIVEGNGGKRVDR